MQPTRGMQFWAMASLAWGLISGWIPSLAATTWTGGGDGTDWFDPANWDPVGVPGNDVAVTIDGGVAVLLTNRTAALATLTLADATVTVSNWTTAITADTVTIGDGGTITLPEPFAEIGPSNRIWIVCQDFILADGGMVNADGLGYARQAGPGKASNVGSTGGPGAGHGGHGGAGMTLPGGIAYGSITEPQTPGSGSGKTTNKDGNPGGGVVRIEASGHVLINGIMTANGDNTGGYYGFGRHAGGGAGGSIWISCRTLAATGGVIRANGASGWEVIYGSYYASGGGGGGRIAIHYDPNEQGIRPRPNLAITANPGNGYMNFTTPIAPTEPAVRAYGNDYFTVCHEADWGSVYLSDASGVVQITETVSDIGGHLAFGTGSAPVALKALRLHNAFLGFETNTAMTIHGDVTIESGAGLIGREPLNLTVGGAWHNRGWTRLDRNGTIAIGASLTIADEARFYLDSGAVLSVDGALSVTGVHGRLVLRDLTAAIGGDLTLVGQAWCALFGGATNGTPNEAGLDLTVSGELRLDEGSWLYPYAHPRNGGSPRLTATALYICENAGINADTRGFNATEGPGKGTGTTGLTTSAGAGYGGRGGDAASGREGGMVYGSRVMPVDPGSGGGSTTSATGGRGGGAIRLRVDQIARIEGVLTSNGEAGRKWGEDARNSGGGSGGGIFILAERLVTGSNTMFTVLGGDAEGSQEIAGGGSGGGGRIAIWHGLRAGDRQPLLDDIGHPRVQRRLIESEMLNGFEGTVSAANGTGGYEHGDPGTIGFVKMLRPFGTVILIR